jgi:hypothetical protein
MNTTIDQDRLARFLDPSTHLTRGKGKGANGTIDMCALQVADWLGGGDGTSEYPECVCPVLRAYVMPLNDSELFVCHRDELKAFVPKLLNTRGELRLMVKRAEIAAGYARCAGKCAEYAGKSARYAKAASYAGKSAAWYAGKSAEYAGCAAEYAGSAWYVGKSAEYAAKSATIRKLALDCLEAMIAARVDFCQGDDY